MSYVVEIDVPEALRDQYGEHGYYVHSRRGAIRPPARTADEGRVERFTLDDANGAVEWLTACGLVARAVEVP